MPNYRKQRRHQNEKIMKKCSWLDTFFVQYIDIKENEMGKYEFIFWDVDQTLLDFIKSEDYSLRYTFEQFERKIDTETVLLYSQINDSYWKRLEKGEISKQEVLYGRFRTLFEKLGIQDIQLEEFASSYQRALGSVYFFQDDSYKLCEELSKEYRQFVVTNGVTQTQRNKLELSGLDKLMEDVFISETIGVPKPNKIFFEKCFEKIPGFQKEKAIIIGDSLTSDMQGGNNAGIDCCWYNPDKKVKNSGVRIDYEICNLWEIKDILNGKIRKSENEIIVSD